MAKQDEALKEEVEDEEMTDDVDWFDFVVVEQIELYDD